MHEICAVIARSHAADAAAAELGARVVELTENLSLIPMTNELFDRLDAT